MIQEMRVGPSCPWPKQMGDEGPVVDLYVERSIRIEPFPPFRGRKMILVDGEQWGSINMEQRGRHGVSYWFEQKSKWHHGAITDPDLPKRWQGSNRLHPTIKVDGDRIAERRRRGEAQIKPVEVRLLDKAVELVNRGLLKHPADVEREGDASRLAFRKQLAEEDAAKDAAYLAKAHDLIAEHAPGLNDRDALASAIAAELKAERGRP